MNKLKLILALGSASLFLASCGGSSSGPGTGSSSSSSSSSGSSASCEANLPSFVACTEGDTADIYTISGAITEDFTIDMSATKSGACKVRLQWVPVTPQQSTMMMMLPQCAQQVLSLSSNPV